MEKEDKRIYILSKEKPAKAVVKLGVPLIAGMFIMVLYNLVDTYFIGLMRDDCQLAASSQWAATRRCGDCDDTRQRGRRVGHVAAIDLDAIFELTTKITVNGFVLVLFYPFDCA